MPFKSETVKLSTSLDCIGGGGGGTPLRSDMVRLSTSKVPVLRGGVLLGSSTSRQNAAFITSGNPLPLVSAVENGFTTVKRLLEEPKGLDVPRGLVAISTYVPALVPAVTLMLAEVSDGSVDAEAITSAGGEKAGTKVNVAPLKLNPLTCRFEIVLLKSADLQLMPVMTGEGMTVKLFADVAVCPATVTEIGPVVAAAGTVVVRVVGEAESTRVDAPLN
jgi:hypothetical protein